jgi:cytochrome P450
MTVAIEEGAPQTACPFPFSRSEAPLMPPPEYAALRVDAPASRVKMWNGQYAWIFTRYEDVRAILSSPHFSAVPGKSGYPTLTPARKSSVTNYNSFITMDPPDHGYYRRMITKEFTVKRMEALRSHVQQVTDALIDAMETHGQPADLVAELAGPLPSIVISLMLGVDDSYHREMEALGQQRNDIQGDPARTIQATQRMEEIIEAVLAAKERNPGNGDDLLERLVLDYIEPGHLAHIDAVRMASLLYLAGHETTTNQIALGTLTLLQNPDQLAKLKADPGLIPLAVEEMLRFNTIVQYNSARVATADVEIDGHQIKAGEGVYALLTAANHDPQAFECPAQFDVARQGNSHVAFAFGIHQCLGQSLARMELAVVFETLLRRWPNMRLAIPFEQLEFKNEQLVHGLRRLPIAW